MLTIIYWVLAVRQAQSKASLTRTLTGTCCLHVSNFIGTSHLGVLIPWVSESACRTGSRVMPILLVPGRRWVSQSYPHFSEEAN